MQYTTITLSPHIKKLLVSIAVLLTLTILLVACDPFGDPGSGTPDQQTQGIQYSNNAYSRLSAAEPPIKMTDSLARKEINQRYAVFNNASNFGYFYGFVQGIAQPVIEYIVQGAVFPVDDSITPPQISSDCPDIGSGGSYACGVVVPAAQPDGTFNTNGAAMFGFTAAGVYFEWLGPYAYGTHPLAFHVPVVEGCPATLRSGQKMPQDC